jgi:hypothetical protein
MRKSSLIPGVLSGLFILCLAHLGNRNSALESELATNRLRCNQQVERLQRDYQAEIDDLRQYLQQHYSAPAPGGMRPDTRQAATDARQPALANRERKPQQSVEKVGHKYRFLYDDLPDLRDAGAEILQQLVLEREELAALADPNNGERMGGIEAQIGELLGAEGFQKYQILKTSDNEQHHLDEFAKSLEPDALTPEQERSLLFAKLRHKQVYENTLRDAGVYWGKWSSEERSNLQTVISKAVETYKNNYLQEARQSLSAAQFNKLSSYETTEFNWERERMLRLISSKH